jgi:hypothetical protein
MIGNYWKSVLLMSREFSPGMRVLINTNNPQVKDWIDGKIGNIIARDEGLFDWVVEVEGTPRLGGMFGLYEDNLSVV